MHIVMTLASFYCLVRTRLYPGLSQDFAFAIGRGGDCKPASLAKTHLTALAEQLGMRPQFIARQAADPARRVLGAFDLAI